MARPAIHPGKMIASEMEALNMSISDLAEALQLTESHVSLIVDGLVPLNEDIAARLDSWLHNGADFWLDLQKEYEYRKAAIEQEEAERIERNRQLPQKTAKKTPISNKTA